MVASDKGKLLFCKGSFSVTAPSGVTNGWNCKIRNIGNQAINILGVGMPYTLNPGCTSLVQFDGTNFTVVELKKRTYSQRLQIESTQSFVVPADTYVIRAYAVGAGGNGGAAVANTSSGAGGSGGGMAYGDIAVTPGETLSVTIASRIAKVRRGATDLLVGNPAAHSVNATPGAVGTAIKHSGVTNGGAYSGGLGGAGWNAATANGGSGASSGSPLGAGVAGGGGHATIAHGGSGWGGGSGGTVYMSGGGGGVGGPSYGVVGGPGLPEGVSVLDPLLHDCVAPPNNLQGVNSIGSVTLGVNGLPGQGGQGSTSVAGGVGGFGGGGGCSIAAATTGGNGGFGGGGGSSGGVDAVGGNGGFGGGGSGGRVNNAATYPAGAGGAAAVIIIWD